MMGHQGLISERGRECLELTRRGSKFMASGSAAIQKNRKSVVEQRGKSLPQETLTFSL